jgi:hypothetical protein
METQKSAPTKDYAIDDAPVHYGAEEACAWSSGADHGYAEGYAAAMAEVAARTGTFTQAELDEAEEMVTNRPSRSQS